MKPKTLFQKEAVEGSKHLASLSDAQKKSAIRHTALHLAKIDSQGICYCLDCGHSWQTDKKKRPSNVVCPHCGSKLKVDTTHKRKFSSKEYFCLIASYRDYQVVRIFFVQANYVKGKKACCFISEAFQWWINAKGQSEIIGRKRKFNMMYYDIWDFDSEMDLRREHRSHFVCPSYIYGRMTITAQITRNGFKGEFHDISPQELFCSILSDNRMETLLKTNQTAMLRHCIYSPRYINNVWASLKVCIRKGYIIEDASLWCDYISLLDYFHKDIHNPKFVCPADLKTAHDELMHSRQMAEEKKRRKRQIEARRNEEERLLRQIDSIKNKEAKYRKAKGQFFGLAFTDGEITIHVLDSVKSFLEESKLLEHCVFTNRYYEKSESLILSASVQGVSVETIELNLSSMNIIQCRGRYNQSSPYHERILQLMNKNINQVAQRMTA